MSTITIRLPDGLKERVAAAAERAGTVEVWGTARTLGVTLTSGEPGNTIVVLSLG